MKTGLPLSDGKIDGTTEKENYSIDLENGRDGWIVQMYREKLQLKIAGHLVRNGDDDRVSALQVNDKSHSMSTIQKIQND